MANAAQMKNASVALFAAVIFFLIFIVPHEVFGDYPVYEYDYKRYNYRKKPKSVRDGHQGPWIKILCMFVFNEAYHCMVNRQRHSFLLNCYGFVIW